MSPSSNIRQMRLGPNRKIFIHRLTMNRLEWRDSNPFQNIHEILCLPEEAHINSSTMIVVQHI